jgi:hypothetical protein
MLDIELATVALAFVYFERLVLQGTITKTNRRLAIATCLVLAYKWNERTDRLPALLQWIDRVWYASARAILKAELGVFSLLNFALHVPLAHVASHFFRILKAIELPPKQYLGEAMLGAYLQEEEREEGGPEDGDSPLPGDGGGDEERGEDEEDEDDAMLLARWRARRRFPGFFAVRTGDGIGSGRKRGGSSQGQSQSQSQTPSWALAARGLRWRLQGPAET